MTRPSLAGIEKRTVEATPGPWKRGWYAGVVNPKSRVMTDRAGYNTCLADYLSEPDAAFIVAARTAVPALTAAVRDVLTALAPHWGAQVRREAKFGRSGSACVCEACDAMRALAAHLDLTDPEGDPT